MTDDDKKERLRLYERTRDQLNAIARSSSETLDRSLLTLSSAFLGGSLAFIGQVVDLSKAPKWLLYGAWLAFALTIIVTIWSFVYGLGKHEGLVQAAERYYIKGEQQAWKTSEEVHRQVLLFVRAGGVLFVLGVFLLVIFIWASPAKG